MLILENTEHDLLNFFAASGSDTLNYTVDQSDIIKIKISFLVSDLGQEEEIYGSTLCKVKGSDLGQQPLKLKNLDIINDYEISLGNISLEVSKGMSPKGSPKIKTTGDH